MVEWDSTYVIGSRGFFRPEELIHFKGRPRPVEPYMARYAYQLWRHYQYGIPHPGTPFALKWKEGDELRMGKFVGQSEVWRTCYS